MSSTPPTVIHALDAEGLQQTIELTGVRRRQLFPSIPLVLAGLLGGFALFPPVSENPRLVWTFVTVAAAMVAWVAILGAVAKHRNRSLEIELVRPIKSHYVQASVQASIYLYWGWYWPRVYTAAPLILAQIVFLYLVDALLSWSRGRNWRPGFGPLPIVFSTNFFMWFKDDWFMLQFVMVATGALAKEFIRWTRDGKKTHIFNPSAFGLSLASIILIATGTTHYTWGIEVATTLGWPPHIYLEIFLLGLIVQYYFSVTLMTFSAVATLYVMNVIYTGNTGVYHFVDTNIPIAVFLGMHLLVTDPSTSPRTNAGRVIFGILYGIGNWVLFSILGNLGVPDFYDKLLPVPILNLLVKVIDRFARSGFVKRLFLWETHFQPKKLNLVYMGGWVALFVTMLSTGFVDAPHEGASVAFWKKAYEEGKPDAGRNWMKMVGSRADSGSAVACNQLGLILLEGKVTPQNREAAAHYFARASALGDLRGSENVAWQFLTLGQSESADAVSRAFDHLEQSHHESEGGRASSLLGFAHEVGRGRPLDKARALDLYREGCSRGDLDSAKGMARLWMAGDGGTEDDLVLAAPLLTRSCDAGDAQGCLFLARMLHAGKGVPRDEAQARALMEKACQLGSQEACAGMNRPTGSKEAPPAAIEK